MAKKSQSKSKPKPRLQDRLAAVEVFEQTIIASVVTPTGIARKVVTAADVVRMFMPAGSAVQWSDFSGSVVAAGVGADGSRHVLVVRKAKRTRVMIQIGKTLHRPWMRVPNLLAEMVGRGDQWIRLERVFAFRGQLSEKTDLYTAPFPNMHGDGHLCMGSVDLKTLGTLSPSAAFEKAFFESVFTDHLLDGAMRNKTYRNIWDAIKKTKGKVPFSVLKKVTTYGKLIKP